MASKQLRCILFLGSTREGRFGLRVAKFITKQLEKRNYQVEVFDPVELKFPLLEKAIHFYEDRSAIPAWMLDCEAKVKAADAFVVVSPEYNHSIPPALSNMMNHFDPKIFSYKPCGIVTYSIGPYGGMCVAIPMREFFAILSLHGTTNVLSIPEVDKALDENGTPLNGHVMKHSDSLLNQLDWVARAMKSYKDQHGLPQ